MKALTKISIDISKVDEFAMAKDTQNQLVIENPYIDVVDIATYEVAKKRRTNFVKGRTNITKGTKAINSQLNAFKTTVKGLEGELIEITLTHEIKQQEPITKWEEKKKAEKAERDRIKAEQMIEWNKNAQSILDYTDSLINAGSPGVVKSIQSDIQDIELTEAKFGAYLLIAQQNAAKVLEQSQTVLERMEVAEIEAEEQRIKLEQEQEQKKVDQLVKSRVDYKGYFHSIPDVEHTAKQLDKLVEDDKQAKLDKLAEIEAAELQKATEGTVAPVKKDESKPEQELKEKIIPTDDTDKDAVKLWLGSFMDSAPKTKNGNLNETIDKAIEFVNDLLGKMY
jgi:hypothetical protein